MNYQAIKAAIEEACHEFCLAGPGTWGERQTLFFHDHPDKKEQFVIAAGMLALFAQPAKFEREQWNAALEDGDDDATGWLPLELEGVPPFRQSALVEIAPGDWRRPDEVSNNQDDAFRERVIEKHERRARSHKSVLRSNALHKVAVEQRLPGGNDLLRPELRRQWQQRGLFEQEVAAV